MLLHCSYFCLPHNFNIDVTRHVAYGQISLMVTVMGMAHVKKCMGP